MKGAIKWATGNHVAANFAMLAVLLAGFMTWFELRKEIFPETALDSVRITVPYPNSTPEDVESGVIIPIEEAIAEVEGIERISSTAAEGLGTVIAQVLNGYDVRDVMDDIKTQVDAVDNLAENAERPVLEELVLNNQVLSIAISGETTELALRKIGEDVRDDLLAYTPNLGDGFFANVAQLIRGDQKITRVSLSGARPYEISIEVSQEKLRFYGLTLADVASAVRRSSVDLPAGSIKTQGGEVVVRSVGRRYRGEEFLNIPIVTNESGAVVLLSELAVVNDGFEDLDVKSSFDGKPSVVVDIYRIGDEDTIVIADAVEAFVADRKDKLPPGITMEIWNDQSSYLRGRLNLLARNAATGLALVFIVLALFLRPSLAFLVALGIPVSFAGGIWLMPTLDISINMISLFAFILVLGIVVDDAIVVGENVYDKIQSGMNPKKAAYEGTHEVGVIVIFGILTTMIAFTPMLGLSGVSGKIWPNIPLIVIPTLAFSLVQSKFVLPAHLALLRPRDPERKVGPLTRLQRKVADGLEVFVAKVYQPFLEVCLRVRYIVVAVFLVLLMGIAGLIKGGWIRSEFFPSVEADLLNARLEMPRGVPFETTAAAIERIAKAVDDLNQKYVDERGIPVVKHVRASAGIQPFTSGFTPGSTSAISHIGEVSVELYPSEERNMPAEQFKEEWRQMVGEIPGVSELSFRAESGSGGNAIDIEIYGSNLTQLRAATESLKEDLANFPGVIEIADNDRLGKKEFRFKELTPEGRALGLRLSDISNQVRRAFYGEEVDRLQRGREEVKVLVRYPSEARRQFISLEDLDIRTPAGGDVPLLQVVVPDYGRGPDTINRVDRQRSIKLTADIDKTSGANANEVVKRFTEESLATLSTRFPGVSWGFQGEQKDQRNSIKEMGTKFAIALVLMYVMMAIPLRSYIQPAIVMSVIPFGIVGAVMGHILMNTHLSIMSMCGIVALAGVVVNDSLVMVDYVNRYRGQGDDPVEAARRAGGRRFRAILLTSLTTFAGLLPMLFETDIQARFLIPMAISLGFGILFATGITLILVPSVYLILNDITTAVSRYWNWRPAWISGSQATLESRHEA